MSLPPPKCPSISYLEGKFEGLVEGVKSAVKERYLFSPMSCLRALIQARLILNDLWKEHDRQLTLK